MEGLQVLYHTFAHLRVLLPGGFGRGDRAASGYSATGIPWQNRWRENLGLAFQLTNIIRDIKEDAGTGRIYVRPKTLSGSRLPCRVPPERDSRTLTLAAVAEADRAREYYTATQELMPLIDEDSQPALWVLVSIYRRLLEKIVERGVRRFLRSQDQPHGPGRKS